MNEREYAKFCKEMVATAAVSSTVSRRRGMEQVYWKHHYDQGVRLRAKYRPR